MKMKIDNNVFLISEEKYKKEIFILKKGYHETISKMNELWGLMRTNKNTNLYIMESTNKFLFSTFPVYKKILLILIFPYWYINMKKSLNIWSGLTNQNRRDINIMIKPIDSKSYKVSSNYSQIYRKSKDSSRRFEIACYTNLMNIFFVKSFPLWLKEGIKIFTAESLISSDIIKKNTILWLKEKKEKIKSISIDNSKNNDRVVIYNYAKGYWIVKYLEEEHPGFLKEVLKTKKRQVIVDMIGKKMNLEISDRNQLWRQIDEFLYDKYKYLIED